MHFTDQKKGLVLNKGNAKKLTTAYGQETDQWAGKKVTIYYDPNVEFGGELVGGLRVRMPSNGQRTGGNDIPGLPPSTSTPKLSMAEAHELERLWALKGVTHDTILAQLKYFGARNTQDLLVEQANKLKAKLQLMPDVEIPGTSGDGDVPF